jgi:hypothetical protein
MSRVLKQIVTILNHHGYRWPEGAPPADLSIRRIRAGRHQRAAGAWSWCLFSPTVSGLDVGSQYPAGKVAATLPRNTSLYLASWGSTSIFIERPKP